MTTKPTLLQPAAHHSGQSKAKSLHKLFCDECDNHPEGFRGSNERGRHQNRMHFKRRQLWICVDGSNEPGYVGGTMPAVPLAKCRHCVEQKRYGAYYNAAARYAFSIFHSPLP
jgi:hypothetical protein